MKRIVILLAAVASLGASRDQVSSRALIFIAATVALSGCGPKSVRVGAHNPDTPCQADLPPAAHAPATAGMALIRGGIFDQGSAAARAEEGPPHRSRVGDFWIDRTEVTNADFARFVAATGYVTLAERPLDPKAYPTLTGDQLKPSAIVFLGAKDVANSDPSKWWRVVRGADWRHPLGPASSIAGQDSLPVVQIAFPDALAYARWLGRDLPTEAEWEYAARGGLKAARYTWGDAPFDPQHPQANIWQGPFPAVDLGQDGYRARVAPVGCFPTNGYGLFDMAGNVWEWTRDWYRPNLDPAAGDNPQGPAEADALDPGDPTERKHVIKGGSFLCADNFCFRYRPPARAAGPTDTGSNHVGFRTILRVGG